MTEVGVTMKTLQYAALIGTLSVIAVTLLDYLLVIYAERGTVQSDGRGESSTLPEAKISDFVWQLEQKFQESWKE